MNNPGGSSGGRGIHSSGRPATRKHPAYRGIRFRSGKWVSEIREPRKTTRIWLGTYESPEMAAAVYDVAALALKGHEAVLNFPDMASSYPVPESASHVDIRAAAERGAHLMTVSVDMGNVVPADLTLASEQIYIDEEEIFDYPNLLVDMADGMLISLPRMESPASYYDLGGTSSDGLWNYT